MILDVLTATQKATVVEKNVIPITTSGVKPKYRGIPDVIAIVLAIPATFWLLAAAKDGMATTCATLYGISTVLLFGISAAYHAPMWPLHIRGVMRKFDHATIYILIAGGYMGMLPVFPQGAQRLIVIAMAVSVVAGILKSFLWAKAPRTLNSAIYVGMGWFAFPYLPELASTLGPGRFSIMLFGGLLYTVGAIFYAKRWPALSPRVFGYHEVFHVMIVLASASHYYVVWTVLT